MPLVGGRLVSDTNVFVGPLTHVAQDLTVAAVSPGGPAEASWRLDLRPPYFDVLTLKPFLRVDLKDAGGLYWRGRLFRKRGTVAAERASFTLTAVGPSASLGDRLYDVATTIAAGTAIEAAIKSARDTLCPDLDTANTFVKTTGRSLTAALGPYTGRSTQDVLNDLIKLGDSSNRQLLWHVRSGTETGKPLLEIIARPTVPTRFVSLAEGATIDFEESADRLANRILVLWGTALTAEVREDFASQTRYRTTGFSGRHDRLAPVSGLSSAADARKLADTLLGIYSGVRVSATSINVPAATPIRDQKGERVQPWDVESLRGTIIKVPDFQLGATRATENEYLIARAEWNETAQTTTLTPEGQEDMGQVIGRFIRDQGGI